MGGEDNENWVKKSLHKDLTNHNKSVKVKRE